MRADLQRLKRDTDSSRHVSAGSAEPAASAPAVVQPARSSSSSAVVAAARQHKLGFGITSGIVILLVAAAAYGIYALLSRSRPVPFQNYSVNKVTETGKAKLVAMSPDGKYILNVLEENGQQGLWLRNVATNSNTQVMPPAPVQYIGLQFSPDGNYLYFVRGEVGQGFHSLYRAPVLGGTPQKLVANVDTNITFSPDGQSLAYVVYQEPEFGKFRLVVYSLSTGEGKTLVIGDVGQFFGAPAWSPDGKTIVCAIHQPGDALSGLVAVDPLIGKQKLFAKSKSGFLDKLAWLPDGKGLLVLSLDKATNYTRNRIVAISYPDGVARDVTHDVSDYSDLSLAADGHTLAAIVAQGQYNLFVVPASALGSGQAEQLTHGLSVSDFSWTPDGQIIFMQNFTLQLFNLESRSQTPLTSAQEGAAGQPSSCPNGRFIVFTLGGHGGTQTITIWRMDSGGGNLKQLSDGKNDESAVCSPDGQWVFYWDESNGGKLVKVPLEAGKTERVSELPVFSVFDISPDGKLAAFQTIASYGSTEAKVALLPVNSPQNAKSLDEQRPSAQASVRFTHDGKAVVYPFLDRDADNLWLQPLDGSPGKQITNFKSEQITDFHWSFDGSKVGMIRGHTDSDVVLMEESKP
jgi:Tol biopolymer transport system component